MVGGFLLNVVSKHLVADEGCKSVNQQRPLFRESARVINAWGADISKKCRRIGHGYASCMLHIAFCCVSLSVLLSLIH